MTEKIKKGMDLKEESMFQNKSSPSFSFRIIFYFNEDEDEFFLTPSFSEKIFEKIFNNREWKEKRLKVVDIMLRGY